MRKNRSRKAISKAAALLLALILMLTAGTGATFGRIAVQTPTLLNIFFSGLAQTGDLVIGKEVTHPFGSGYVLPTDLEFTFTLSFGQDLAGQSLETSRGVMQTDEKGDLAITLAPGGTFRVRDLPLGTQVTVTESPAPGFTPAEGGSRTVTIRRGDNRVDFTNVYAPGPVEQVPLTVEGVKILEGRDWQEGDCFSFLLEYKLAGEGSQWQTAGTAQVRYDPDDPDFDKFSFTSLIQTLRFDTAGVYAFRVSETAGDISGITYDQVVSYFDVTVGDADMDGTLEIQRVAGYQTAAVTEDGTGFHVNVTVRNLYAPEGTAPVRLNITKSVLDLSGGEMLPAGFTFELHDETGSLIAVSDPTSAAGETGFDLIFQAADAGQTFHYVLKETHAGETDGALTYDSTAYAFSVTVVDDLDGTISAVVDQTGDNTFSGVFVNVYDPADARVELGGVKELTGRDLTKGEFTFELYETGENMEITGDPERVFNDAEGNFAFETRTFDKIGTYYFVILEADTQAEGVTYDDTRYGVKVTVTDDGQGSLEALCAIWELGGGEVDGIRFENSYQEPTEPDTTVPDTTGTETTETTRAPDDSGSSPTSDANPLGAFMLLMLLSAAGMTLLVILRRRTTER